MDYCSGVIIFAFDQVFLHGDQVAGYKGGKRLQVFQNCFYALFIRGHYFI